MMTVLIPMAGQGKRFEDEGFLKPKPIIEVSEQPMIIQAVNSLPKADSYVFVCRQDHVDNYQIDKILKSSYPNSHVKAIDYITEGQASTCLLGEHYIEPESQLLIAACDNGMRWNADTYNSLISDESIDAIIWAFKNNVTVKRNPHMYGWIEVDENNRAKRISCKKPISNNPVEDYAIVATFWFRRAWEFFSLTKLMIKKDRRINNEFYVDELMNEFIEAGLKVKVFEIDKYICWGTPNDLRLYEYWEQFFKKAY